MRSIVFIRYYARPGSLPFITMAGGPCSVQGRPYARYFSTCLQQEILREAMTAGSSPSNLLKDGTGDSSRSGHCRHHPEIDISREGLSHLESPEMDEALRKKLSQNIDQFFSSIPLPKDPMAAALAPTPEEVEENLAGEALKETVREAYWRRVDAQRREESRIATAMERRFAPFTPSSTTTTNFTSSFTISNLSNKGDCQSEAKRNSLSETVSLHEVPFSTSSSCSALGFFSSPQKTFSTDDGRERSIREELEAMRARVRELEEQLEIKEKSGNE